MQEPTAGAIPPEENRNDPGFLDIAEPDGPIYRIFPLWFLEEALWLRQLVLVPRASWEDPHEVLEKRIAVSVYNGGVYQRQVMIGEGLPQAFAQCWSATPESDALLRAYSRVVKDTHFQRNTCPRDEGVRVRSTPRKLLQALRVGTRDAGSTRKDRGVNLSHRSVAPPHQSPLGRFFDSRMHDLAIPTHEKRSTSLRF